VGSRSDDDTPGTSPSAEVLSGSGLAWHLREATRIARFDPDAIARTAQHRRALFYGAGFLSLGIVGALLSDTLASPADPESAEVPPGCSSTDTAATSPFSVCCGSRPWCSGWPLFL
jgi:hypothetical protein